MSDSFYKAFEDRYRGSRDEIVGRLRAYLPFLAPLAANLQPARALDLGCGRGEWLELVSAHGFAAHGVDLDDGMLAACRERGLKVHTGDALAALRECADASLALVSAFHLVEHLPFDLMRELIAEALRALRPGGLLILETPNPENLSVGANSFYLDPSHHQPIPPTLLDFVVDFAGFGRRTVVRLQENPRARGGERPRLIDVLEGTSSDYAVVAQKAGAPELEAALDAPFGASYGITLGTLAERYDDDAERARALERQHDLAYVERLANKQEAELRHVAETARAHTDAARAHADAALVHPLEKLADLDWRLIQLEQRALVQEQRIAEYQQRIADLLASSSWRVTAPLRWASEQAMRARAAVREGRVLDGLKRRALPLLLAAVRAALRRPRLKRVLRAVLRRFPALQARLYGALARGTVQAAAEVPPQQYGELSPRALRMYQQLKREMDARKN